MKSINRNSLLDALNARPYSNWGYEDDALLMETQPVDQQQSVVNINLEQLAEEWKPIQPSAILIDDHRLPNWFLDGSVTSVEIAGCASDDLGYPRVIRAGQLGVGATSRVPHIMNRKLFWRFIALNLSGYRNAEITSLRDELLKMEVPHDLIDWQSNDIQDPEKEHDLATIRTLVRNQTRDEMLLREKQLVEDIGEAIYVDGRYVDHAPASDTFLVVGIIKSQRARYLSNRPLQVMYNLKEGERTPAFLIERSRGQVRQRTTNRVITFYLRLTSPDLVGPGGGLARIEIAEQYYRNQIQDEGNNWCLLDAIAADLARLRTRDVSYARGAVTIEPIRLIERELQLIFHDTQMAAMETLRLLN